MPVFCSLLNVVNCLHVYQSVLFNHFCPQGTLQKYYKGIPTQMCIMQANTQEIMKHIDEDKGLYVREGKVLTHVPIYNRKTSIFIWFRPRRSNIISLLPSTYSPDFHMNGICNQIWSEVCQLDCQEEIGKVMVRISTLVLEFPLPQ